MGAALGADLGGTLEGNEDGNIEINIIHTSDKTSNKNKQYQNIKAKLTTLSEIGFDIFCFVGTLEETLLVGVPTKV